MSKKIEANYEQIFLLPPSLEDWVPKDHPARFIREFVEALDDAELGFKESAGEDGRPHYSGKMLLKVWLYGYFENIRSSRKLERACLQNIALVWLTGLHYPDHNTIWRFFRDNKKAIKRVFVKVVQVAMRSGLVEMAINAVDGTKIKADVSPDSVMSRDRLIKEYKSLEKAIDKIFDEIEKQEEKEEGQEYRLPQELRDREELKRKIEEELKELEKQGERFLSHNDKDARMIKTTEGNRMSYNAQAAVDSKAGIIVGCEVNNEKSDNSALVEMIDEIVETTGEVSKETVADGGYFSGDELKKAEDKEYEVVVNLNSLEQKSNEKKDPEFDVYNFEYDEFRDVYICPKGGELTLLYEQYHRNKGHTQKIYRCENYHNCQFRFKCSKRKKGRIINIAPYHGAIKAQMEKQKLPKKKEILKMRKFIIEPIFGLIKHNMGFRRWTYRGFESVKAQWKLICATVNLKKIYNRWQEGLVLLA